MASKEFQKKKLAQLASRGGTDTQMEGNTEKVLEKTCLCDHLGNGILIGLGLTNEKKAPPLVCPGPNLAWFDGIYSLRRMADHIYGRGSSLVPERRPHMFANEIVMYVDYFERMIHQCDGSPKAVKALMEYRDNLLKGMMICLEISGHSAYPGENLASIAPCVEVQRARLNMLWRKSGFERQPSGQQDAEEPLVVAC
jgi:hypothetical protein